MNNTMTHQWTQRLSAIYYAPYVSMDIFTHIMEQFSQEEVDEAYELVMTMLDYTALGVLAELCSPLQMQEFLFRAKSEYNTDSLRGLVEEMSPDLPLAVQQAVERQLLAIHSALQ